MEWTAHESLTHIATWLWLYNEEVVLHKSLYSMCPEKLNAVPLYYAAKFGFRDLAEHLLIAEHRTVTI